MPIISVDGSIIKRADISENGGNHKLSREERRERNIRRRESRKFNKWLDKQFETRKRFNDFHPTETWSNELGHFRKEWIDKNSYRVIRTK